MKNNKRDKLNVLLLGLDRNVPRDNNSPTCRRLKSYSERIGSLSFVVFSLKGEDFIQSSDENFFVYPTNSKSRLHYFRDAFNLCKWIIDTKGDIDIIASQDPFATGLVAYLVKRKYNIPWACHIHADYLDNRYWLSETFVNRIQNVVGKFLIKKADGIRAVSTLIVRNLIDIGIDPRVIFYATPAVETDIVPKGVKDKIHLKKRYGFDGRKVLLFVGRIDKQKNIPMLLRATRSIIDKYPEALLVCVGGGKLTEKMKGLSRRFGIDGKVIFTGPLNFSDLIDYYLLTDVFLLPSNYEGTAKVLKEAALFGLPLVSTLMSGADDVIIDGESGLLVPVGNAEVFSDKVMELLSDPKRAEAMGRSAKERVVKEFNFDKNVLDIVSTWIKTYNLAK